MALVTFMSDFGTEDHYVAAVKAAILKANPSITIVDISHSIYPSDIGHASYVLKNVFRDFPAGSVHLCAVDMTGREPSPLLALKLEEHYFVGSDCGLFSLLSTQRPTAIIRLNSLKPIVSTFDAKEILAPTAAALASGQNIHEMGPSVNELNVLYGRQLKVTKREISGNILRVDGYGNLITNIVQSEFDTIMKINGHTPFEIHFGREKSRKINATYSEAESGEIFILFNSNGYLQIGINKGNASELLGLNLDAPVIINFEV
ncbi:MAG: SAM-dependent chlorinase/fluorinase [Marinoscillum sp.]